MAPKVSPHQVLTTAEVQRLLRGFATDTLRGLRDRAIVETLYSTGVRRRELLNLHIEHLDFHDGVVRVLAGKGNKDRTQFLNSTVRHYITAAGIDKPGSCHILRRTMATHMLANGAGIRAIQEILGHARITATQVYTKLNIDNLKQVHARTHPTSRDAEP